MKQERSAVDAHSRKENDAMHPHLRFPSVLQRRESFASENFLSDWLSDGFPRINNGNLSDVREITLR